MSATNYTSAMHNTPEEQISHLHHSESLKSCILNLSCIHTALASMTHEYFELGIDTVSFETYGFN